MNRTRTRRDETRRDETTQAAGLTGLAAAFRQDGNAGISRAQAPLPLPLPLPLLLDSPAEESVWTSGGRGRVWKHAEEQGRPDDLID